MTDSLLSERESEAFRYLAEGLTPQEIAVQMGTAAGTINTYLQRIREKLEVRTNAQAVLKAAWYHPRLLKGLTIKHGTLEALDWHEDREIPPCPACQTILNAQQARVKIRTERPGPKAGNGPYRRLTPVEQHAKRGQPVEHGTIQMARRHIRAKERINDLTCGCREAYQAWWREYQQQVRALGA